MADEIVELLKNSKLRAKIVQVINDVYSYAGTLHDNPTDDMEEDLKRFGEESLWEEAWWRAEIFGEAERIERAFREYVIEKMQKPHRISLEEVVETFLSLAKPGEYSSPGLESKDFDNIYTTFINYVQNHILSYRCSGPFSICIVPDNGEEFVRGLSLGYQAALAKLTGHELQRPDLHRLQEESQETLWCKNGINVRLLGKRYFKTRFIEEKHSYLDAAVDGRMSNFACEQLQAKIGRILPSVILSASLLDPARNANRRPQRIKQLPLATETLLHKKKALIQRSLDAYYSEPTKKDSIDRRIRNAVRLLIESDAQSNDALGLALSTAAIEALLGERGQEISQKLAENVGVLLEPDLSKRNNAEKFMKDLYDIRSRALHGEKIETEHVKRKEARHLAAGVLVGMISRRGFVQHLGCDPETPKELLEEIRDARYRTPQPPGVEESNVRQLWGTYR